MAPFGSHQGALSCRKRNLCQLFPDFIKNHAKNAVIFSNRIVPYPKIAKTVDTKTKTFSLPFSVLPELLVDGQTHSVPMVTEEPSVVAAASFGAKIIAKSGGFTTTIHNRIMIGQVALYAISDHSRATQAILDQKESILETANQAHPSIVKRGGGARELTVESKDEFLIVYLQVDVQEAMGANILKNLLEAIKDDLEELSKGQALMGILSNYATESLVTAQCHITISSLATSSAIAQETAQKIALASKLAQVDPYRAATHNKGIFNGIDAVVIATGNDWRAVEAGAHAYASRDGQYKGLSTWSIDDNHLVGSITLPLPIASVGGSIGLNPKVAVAFDLLQQPKARQLASIIASVGLCQNFAALRALVTSGIQSGHMKLQAKSLALLAGAVEHEVDQLAQLLWKEKHSNLETAQNLLAKMREH